MAEFLDICRFIPTAGGSADWTFAAAATGYQSPAAAGAANGAVYRYRAESSDLSQWEIGYGAYNSSTGVVARSSVLFNSSGNTSKINFSAVPQVAIVALAEDLPSLTKASNAFTGNMSIAGALQLTGQASQFSAALSVRGDQIEFGHANTGGYGSVLSDDNGGGAPYLLFNGQRGTTNNTYKTVGIKGSLIKSDMSGGVIFGQISNTSADNQAFAQNASITTAGIAISTATTSTSTTTGALTVLGGVGVTGALFAGGRATAPGFVATVDISSNGNPNLDCSGQVYSIANGATLVLQGTSGLLIATEASTNGGTALFLLGANSVIMLGSNPIWQASSSPSAGTLGVFFNGTSYAIKSNVGSTDSVYLCFIRTRPAP
jgi:hypothetical protein